MKAESLLTRFSTPLVPRSLLATLNPRWRAGAAVVESVTPNGSAAVRVVLRPGRDWPGHRAGQHVTVGVDIDGVRHRRSYSLTSSGVDGTVEISVADAPDGTVSRHFNHDARRGDIVDLGAVAGTLTLDRAADGPLLMLSGGSGITPIVGMLRSLAVEHPRRDVVVVHHARTADRVMYGRELARLAGRLNRMRLEVVLTREGGRHLDLEALTRHCPDWRRRTAFACGPAALVDVATEIWATAHLDDRLHTESFTPPVLAAPDDADPAEATVDLAQAGVSLTAVAGTTLLDAVEAAGHLPPSGCRVGVCHTCSTRVVAGCARDGRDGRLVEPGAHVQLCVSGAASDLTLDL